MIVYYDFVVRERLKKAKKPELVKFAKEVLGEKISTAEKKEVFLKAVEAKVRDRSIRASQWAEYFGWEVKDIASDLRDGDVFHALELVGHKIKALYFEKKQADLNDDKKEIQKHIGKLNGILNDSYLKLVNQKKAKIMGMNRCISICDRAKPIFIDAGTNQRIDNIEDYIFFPNGKYCKVPEENETLDLNNINFVGDYREKDFKVVTSKTYVIVLNKHRVKLPYSYKDKITVEVDEEKLPWRFYNACKTKPKRNRKPPAPIDELEYRKAIYILNGFLHDEIKEARKKKKAKEIALKQAERELEKKKRLKAQAEARAKAKARGRGRGKGRPKKKSNNPQNNNKPKPNNNPQGK